MNWPMTTIALLIACAMSSTLIAADPPAWTPVFEQEQWYKQQDSPEQIFTGALEAVPPPQASTLMRVSLYRLGDRTVYTTGKKVAALDALVGKKVDIRGKAYDMELEGQSVKEIWPGAIRAAS